MSLSLKPTHATVKAYYETVHQFGQLYIDHEGAVRSAFQTLLAKCGQRAEPKLTLVPEYLIKRTRTSVRVDGALVDDYKLPHGYWEAKDEKDDLAEEVKRKFEKGYPRDNIIFQAPERAILYQGGTRIFDENISRPEALVSVVNQFFTYKAPQIDEWLKAVNEFSDRVPELSQQVENLIKEERRRNPSFLHAFEDFYALCRQAINPNLSEEAVERMLVQHLLTERIFRKIFNNPDFSHRNVVAAEIEKVIAELTKRSLNRDEFLKRLEPFYHAIERNAENATEYTAKQDFLNTVYMRFFQGYSPNEADTHGIVYSPQPIVNFMVRSVEEILKKEFGRSLGDKGVHILDPFVGTGNFIVRIMQEIKATDLQYKYENELHCNEVMLLPYYIASMNIEHAYFERTGEYQAFPGICLVDTFELAEGDQAAFGFVTAENAERVKRQKESPIFVIIGNPPYNVGQLDENDNNKNRRYPSIENRVAATYGSDSEASSISKLNDPYVKAIRWASDRIGGQGLVALVNNDSFIDQIAFDGVRRHLAADFDAVYVLDLGGNVRKNPDLSGTTHNVFGIKVGVSIQFLVRRGEKPRRAEIHYAATERDWRKEQKYAFLDSAASAPKVRWQTLIPDDKNTWLTESLRSEFQQFLPLGDKASKGESESPVVFSLFSLGVNTNRDAWAYNYQRQQLERNMEKTIDFYNAQLAGWFAKTGGKGPVEQYISQDSTLISWSEGLKNYFRRGSKAKYDAEQIRTSLYRPFTKQNLYFDAHFDERRYQMPSIFPTRDSENLAIWVKVGTEISMFALAADVIPNLLAQGGSQCFPFYTYAEDGTHRRENITDWALEQFRNHYHDPSIAKWDILHYIYAVLHHPDYRERYAANLRRELPRIPFASANPCHPEAPSLGAEGPMQSAGVTRAADESIDPSARKERGPQDDKGVFRAFAGAGQRLAEIHVRYEQQPEYPLTKTEKKGEKLDYRVTKMKLSKDKTSLLYNQFLTLSGIPKETYDYRLGNRSALEWVIDQYQMSTDKRSGITNDPNRADDPQYILRLIGQVVTVSLETVEIVRSLPSLGLSR